MVTIKENVWIPKLQEISKAVIRKCFECKRFHIKLFSKEQRGILLSDITTGKFFSSNWWRFCRVQSPIATRKEERKSRKYFF